MGGEKKLQCRSFYSVGFCKQKTFLGQMDGVIELKIRLLIVILVNINTLKGKVYENGALVTDENKTNALKKEELVDQ
jgi:hypothetical protein